MQRQTAFAHQAVLMAPDRSVISIPLRMLLMCFVYGVTSFSRVVVEYSLLSFFCIAAGLVSTNAREFEGGFAFPVVGVL